MARSLVRLSGRRRVASALGAGVLAGSLALAGCSSSSPQGGGTIPPVSSASAGSGSTASPAPSGGASAGASGTAVAVTAESLSDPDLGYTVVSIPEGLDAMQTKVLQGFVAYDKLTWRIWSTGEALTNGTKRAENMRASGERLKPPIRVAVESVVTDPSAINATVEVCEDQTQMIRVDSQGRDITKPEEKVNLPAAITMIPSSADKWVISREVDGEGDTCSASK